MVVWEEVVVLICVKMDGELFFDVCKSEVVVSLEGVFKEDFKVDLLIGKIFVFDYNILRVLW